MKEDTFWKELKDDWTGRIFESKYRRKILHTLTVKEDLKDSVRCEKVYAIVADVSKVEVFLSKSLLKIGIETKAYGRVK